MRQHGLIGCDLLASTETIARSNGQARFTGAPDVERGTITRKRETCYDEP
jgi:hypothetical protein